MMPLGLNAPICVNEAGTMSGLWRNNVTSNGEPETTGGWPKTNNGPGVPEEREYVPEELLYSHEINLEDVNGSPGVYVSIRVSTPEAVPVQPVSQSALQS